MVRQRPRLKPFRIVCALAECGRSAVRYYPSRATTRGKMSPRTYCCAAHARRDGARRRRQQAYAERVEQAECLRCGRPVAQPFRPGRPSVYCGTRCREAAAQERRRRAPSAAVAQAKDDHRRALAAYEDAQEHDDDSVKDAERITRHYEEVLRTADTLRAAQGRAARRALAAKRRRALERGDTATAAHYQRLLDAPSPAAGAEADDGGALYRHYAEAWRRAAAELRRIGQQSIDSQTREEIKRKADEAERYAAEYEAEAARRSGRSTYYAPSSPRSDHDPERRAFEREHGKG